MSGEHLRHTPDCAYHLDQYLFECDCGAVPRAPILCSNCSSNSVPVRGDLCEDCTLDGTPA